MLLVLDVGNSTTMVGIFEKTQLLQHWRLSSQRHTSDEIGLLLSNLLMTSGINRSEVDAAIISSVVPALDSLIIEAAENYFGVVCLKVSIALDLGMPIRYAAPKELGADRIVNAVAAAAKYRVVGCEKPIIVIDYGTAITFDVISRDGAYLGGAICPGLISSIEALFGKTAKLPQVALESPGSVIAQSTVEAIQSGVLYGNAGMTDKIVSLIEEELGEKSIVIATGGHAGLMRRYSKSIEHVEQWLTLEGLRIIYERNISLAERGNDELGERKSG